MKCAKCGCVESKVIDSRPSDDSNTIRRRRECVKCKNRFTTYERIETSPLLIIKKDGTREQYDRNKIKKGMLVALQKRPVSSDDIDQTIQNIENELFASSQTEIRSTEVGELVMRHLKELDEVAYVRFASVYRQFKDISNFKDELEQLISEQKTKE